MFEKRPELEDIYQIKNFLEEFHILRMSLKRNH